MKEQKIYIEGGSAVWDSYGSWINAIKVLDGHAIIIEPYDGHIEVSVRKEPYTREEFDAKIQDIRDEYEIENNKALFDVVWF